MKRLSQQARLALINRHLNLALADMERIQHSLSLPPDISLAAKQLSRVQTEILWARRGIRELRKATKSYPKRLDKINSL
jgi:hypothetical protein